MAELSYTDVKALAKVLLSVEEMSRIIDNIIKSGPHSEYSHEHADLKFWIQTRRQTMEESKRRVTNDSIYLSDVIEYPEEKEAS
jgi:hypothetical protein|tara:strand:- start:302 stop:553 length:252 start_codon:yes stop_codon:yes gene_type:complete